MKSLDHEIDSLPAPRLRLSSEGKDKALEVGRYLSDLLNAHRCEPLSKPRAESRHVVYRMLRLVFVAVIVK